MFFGVHSLWAKIIVGATRSYGEAEQCNGCWYKQKAGTAKRKMKGMHDIQRFHCFYGKLVIYIVAEIEPELVSAPLPHAETSAEVTFSPVLLTLMVTVDLLPCVRLKEAGSEPE